jgi:glycosyltransferase involved in cell wall biosynthesis
MPTVSVLTAAYAPSSTYLPATAASVRAQRLPAGWDLEWVVQEDGNDPSLAGLLGDEPHVRYAANGTQLGIAVTRNLALSRVTGDLVQILDHDDVLLPGAVAVLVDKFERHPIHWAVGAADDLMADGTRTAWDSALPFGLLPAGTVNQWAEEHGGNWPVHCAGLMMRTASLRAMGGWGGTPVDDDIVLFAALCELGAGWNEQTVTWLYRQHPAQAHRDETWRSLGDTGRRIALQRAAALRHAGLQFDPAAPLRFGQNSTDVHIGPNIKDPGAG